MAAFEYLQQVCPPFAENDATNRLPVDAILAPHFGVFAVASGTTLADLENLRVGQSSDVVMFPFAVRVSPLSRTIAIVLAPRAEEEVFGVDTSAHVATMEYAQSIGDRATKKGIGQSVGTLDTTGSLEMSIPRVGDYALPEPTTIGHNLHAFHERVPKNGATGERDTLAAIFFDSAYPTLTDKHIEGIARQKHFAFPAGKHGKLRAHRNLHRVSVPYRVRSQRSPVLLCLIILLFVIGVG